MRPEDDRIKRVTVHRTPNLECPACQVKRLHTRPELDKYHPDHGTGIDRRDSRSVREEK